MKANGLGSIILILLFFVLLNVNQIIAAEQIDCKNINNVTFKGKAIYN